MSQDETRAERPVPMPQIITPECGDPMPLVGPPLCAAPPVPMPSPDGVVWSVNVTEDERRRAVLFNDITFAPLSGKGHLMFSDRMRLRDYLWEQGWRRDVRPDDVTER